MPSVLCLTPSSWWAEASTIGAVPGERLSIRATAGRRCTIIGKKPKGCLLPTKAPIHRRPWYASAMKFPTLSVPTSTSWSLFKGTRTGTSRNGKAERARTGSSGHSCPRRGKRRADGWGGYSWWLTISLALGRWGAAWKVHWLLVESSLHWRNNSDIFRWNLELRISWQVQYLVKLEGDSCCSAQCQCTARINHQSHFSWQAQYLVKLEDDSWCSPQCTGRFIWDKDQSSSESLLLAGAVFGELGGWVLLLRALYWTFHVRQGSIIRVIFRCRGWFLLLRALCWTFHVTQGSNMSFICRGRRSIWWSWRVTHFASRLVLDVSFEIRINQQSHFSWQAQSVFGELGGWVLFLRALYWTFHMWGGSIMRLIFGGTGRIWWSWSVTFRGRHSISWKFGR